MSNYRMKNPAKGVEHRGKKRVMVSFDEDTFAEVREIAVRREISFGEAVRTLVEFGLIEAEAV